MEEVGTIGLDIAKSVFQERRVSAVQPTVAGLLGTASLLGCDGNVR